MRVYLAAAMTNPARDLDIVVALLGHLEAAGHEVPTRHVANPLGPESDRRISDQDLARRDLRWIQEADLLVAEVSAPSHGVGVEVSAATGRGIPVLLLYRRGVTVSRLLLGLSGVTAVAYHDEAEACGALETFLDSAGV